MHICASSNLCWTKKKKKITIRTQHCFCWVQQHLLWDPTFSTLHSAQGLVRAHCWSLMICGRLNFVIVVVSIQSPQFAYIKENNGATSPKARSPWQMCFFTCSSPSSFTVELLELLNITARMWYVAAMNCYYFWIEIWLSFEVDGMRWSECMNDKSS